MSSTESSLSVEDGQLLLKLARESIEYGLRTGELMELDLADFNLNLQEPGACFVTIKHLGRLRGCIGSITAYQPLVLDVVDKAFSAAFRDPRFFPLKREELDGLNIHISILTPLVEITFGSEAELLSKIQPGRDGLVLEDGRHKGTFLPVMWEQLPDPQEFLAHLKLKAGLSMEHWSKKLKVWRFYAESVH